jgi:hypothetical protein
LAVLRRKPVGQINARAVFLPVESVSPSAGRWVTPDRRKRFSESDFDSGGCLSHPDLVECGVSP